MEWDRNCTNIARMLLGLSLSHFVYVHSWRCHQTRTLCSSNSCSALFFRNFIFRAFMPPFSRKNGCAKTAAPCSTQRERFESSSIQLQNRIILFNLIFVKLHGFLFTFHIVSYQNKKFKVNSRAVSLNITLLSFTIAAEFH